MSFFKNLLQIGTAILAGFLGPGAFSWGQAAIGNLIGGLLFNRPKAQAPTLGDLQQPESSYDEFIKIVHGGDLADGTRGGVQVAAHIVDGDPAGCIVEEKKTYSIGRYFTGALLWCEAVDSPKTIRAILANGEMIYNADGATDAEKGFILTVDEETGVAEGGYYNAAGTVSFPGAPASGGNDYYLRNYPGNKRQGPDPDLEKFHGTGKVPAYRECCYSMLIGWPLEATDYALPKFEALILDDVTGKAEIVEALALRAGVPHDAIELSALGGEVRGVFMTQQAGAKDLMEAVANYAFCDLVEVDGMLRDSNRQDPVVHTIAIDDLGAHEFGSDLPPLCKIDEKQNFNLPPKVSVGFIDIDNEYQESSALALRQGGTQYGTPEADTTFTLPIAATLAEMTQWAQPALDEAWAAQNAYEFYLPPRYLGVAPGDVVEIETPAGLQRIRVTGQSMGLLGPLRCEGNSYDGSVYSGHRTVTTPGKPAPAIPTYPAPLYVPIDSVAVRDADAEQTGWYLAVGTKFGQAWDVCALECGIPGVLPDYAKKKGGGLEVRNRGTIGTGTLTGPAWGGDTTTFDTASTLTVDMAGGDTPTTSTDSAVQAGANELWFGNATAGWELIRFVNAEFIQDNTDGSKRYELTRLLRGQRGTLDKANGHSAGDTIVFNNSAVVRVPLPSTSLNVSMPYVLHFGGLLGDSVNFSFTVKGASQMPQPVANVTGSRDSDDNLIVEFEPVSRTGGPDPVWPDLNKYEVEIMDGTAVIRLIPTSFPAIVYGAAEQIADFGSLQASVTLKVYRLSAVVGRGPATMATI